MNNNFRLLQKMGWRASKFPYYLIHKMNTISWVINQIIVVMCQFFWLKQQCIATLVYTINFCTITLPKTNRIDYDYVHNKHENHIFVSQSKWVPRSLTKSLTLLNLPVELLHLFDLVQLKEQAKRQASQRPTVYIYLLWITVRKRKGKVLDLRKRSVPILYFCCLRLGQTLNELIEQVEGEGVPITVEMFPDINTDIPSVADIPKQIGPQHFVLLNLLGEGAMGKVLLVRCILNNKLYAMKVVTQSLLFRRWSTRSRWSRRKRRVMHFTSAACCPDSATRFWFPCFAPSKHTIMYLRACLWISALSHHHFLPGRRAL